MEGLHISHSQQQFYPIIFPRSPKKKAKHIDDH